MTNEAAIISYPNTQADAQAQDMIERLSTENRKLLESNARMAANTHRLEERCARLLDEVDELGIKVRDLLREKRAAKRKAGAR